MHLDKSSLSLRLTGPVVPLCSSGSTPERLSSHHDGEMLPPAILRGLLTLQLGQPTKVSSIEIELQAKASTHYVQGAGPSCIDVTEQYKVHSASTVVFKAGSIQERRRAKSTRPGVQFFDDQNGSSAPCGGRLSGVGSRPWQAPSDPQAVTRSASLDFVSPRRRRLSSDELETDYSRNSQRSQIPIGPAPPYSGPADRSSFLNVNSNVAGISPPVASSSLITSENRLTPDIPYGSPASSAHSIRGTMSRTSSIEEVPEDEGEDFDISAARPDNVAYYGLSSVATDSSRRDSEPDYRGRSHSRFSFGSVVHVFEAMKDRVRSRSPRSGSRPRSEERGRSLMKGRGRVQVNAYSLMHALPQTGVAEPSLADGVNNQSGDGWIMFPEGIYTYPVFFTIPNNLPPTMKADHGSLIWKVKAEVKRPGTFKSKMTVQKEVVIICVPKESDSDEVGEIDLERQWEGQLQYRVQIPGRSIPVGGKMPFHLTLMPLAKVKIHSILVYLDERTEYYTRAESRARSDTLRRATLLVIKHNGFDEMQSKPILPLTSDEPDTFHRSPLYRFLEPGENESQVASSFMGPGPWTIRHQLRVPDSCSVLHPSNQTKGSNIMVNHTLRLVLRVEKEEETTTIGRKKLYDIVIHIPIQILSCRCTSEWTSLPRYGEALWPESDSMEDTSTCPCRTRHQVKARTRFRMADTLPSPLEPDPSRETVSSNSSGVLDTFPMDSLAGRTHLHERLISGLVSETGEAPPSYERSSALYAD